MSAVFHEFNMKRLMDNGMTKQEAEIECKRIHEIAIKILCDFEPDWIDSYNYRPKKYPEELK